MDLGIIKNKINHFFNKIDGVKLNYEKNIYTGTHIIEVLPLDVFNSDEYIKAEIEFMEDIEAQFKDEVFLFISSDSLTSIQNPIQIYDERIKNILYLNKLPQQNFCIEGINNYVSQSNHFSLAA